MLEEKLEGAVRDLMLPFGQVDFTNVAGQLDLTLDSYGIEVQDRAATLRRWAAEWRTDLVPPKAFSKLVAAALKASTSPHTQSISASYFKLHKLLRDSLAISFEGASVLIGHARLIGDLAENHSMSAAQIALLLRARGVPADISTWAAVDRVLRVQGLATQIDAAQMQAQLAGDTVAETAIFADAGWKDSIDLVAHLGSNLGLETSIHSNLSTLVPEDGKAIHWPYVFMLHYCCVPLEWYDHDPVFSYEFSPRGNNAQLLLQRYTGFAVRSNPFLNNAKSVDRLDQNWADSKTKEKLRGPASALVNILEALQGLAYPSKKRLGRALRAWCMRQLRLYDTPATLIGDVFDPPGSIAAFLSALALKETGTGGIVEQRATDAIAACINADPQWKSRGLGDSVNAANLPRRKLGDCEFQDTERGVVVAYEAHAGKLTSSYIANHRASFEVVLRRRMQQEWASYSDPRSWSVNVEFIAHTTQLTDPVSFELDGVLVTFTFATYTDFIGLVDAEELRPFIKHHLLEVLNQSRTPQHVRDLVISRTAS